MLTDLFCKRAPFFQKLNSLIARAVNAEFGDWENLFALGSYNAVKLLAGQDVAAKCAYTLLNPTAAGLVKLPEYWDGVTSWGMKYGHAERLLRPTRFFGEELPEEVQLELVRPAKLWPELDDGTARARLLSEVRERAHATAKSIREDGGSFMGMKRVRSQPRHSSPHTREPRRGIKPTVAGKDTEARTNALKELREFRVAYQQARAQWESGNRVVLFPLGTYLMRVRFHVRVAKK